jgi:inosine-uridine nucleoside N-ribohydrolase
MFNKSKKAASKDESILNKIFLLPNKQYIIDTDIGGDIDDSIALLLALNSTIKPIAITTTHIDPEEKARIAKLIVTEQGQPTLPVFVGAGSLRSERKEEFLLKNSLFPSSFGFPNAGSEDKKWYENQGAAYKENYSDSFHQMGLEKEYAPEFIARLAKQCSSDNKLTIVALGPLHNIEAALKIEPTIVNNIRLISMGGLYPKGYNWLISPETSSYVLSRVETICISSEFIVNHNLSFSEEELRKIELNAIKSHFGKAFIADWKNWHKGDIFGKKSTFLYDPVTLYLALHPEEIVSSTKKQVTFPCLNDNGTIKSELRHCWYYMPGLENKIISLQESNQANVTFVDEVRSPEKIKDEIFTAITQGLTKMTELQKKKVDFFKNT